MTSTSSETRPFRGADLGTLAVMAFSGEAPDGDMSYFPFATRAWPEVHPGEPVAPESLTASAGDDETLLGAAQVLPPVRRPRG
ncbi:DUF5949 family protein [Streptomyces sp. NPDC048275]|uniref:DUF5949 family protein n=1 Tax=Streptomyces sp. NPDC048275 TaxID=3155629 RepID=UPI0034063B29